MDTTPVLEPFPIFTLASRYLLYDIDTVSHIRRNYNICGVLIGGLPQAPQQSVFLGLPLELMPEEARLLVEKGVAYIVDDVAAHKKGLLGEGLSAEERRAYHAALRRQGVGAANEAARAAERRAKSALEKKRSKQKKGQITEEVSQNWNDIPDDLLQASSAKEKFASASQDIIEGQRHDRDEVREEDETLFASTTTPPTSCKPPRDSTSQTRSLSTPDSITPFAITPTTSYPPLPISPSNPPPSSPPVPPSYPIFKHLHANGYFLAPGLRFGCQYMAYPGDPLRFHSHFLVNGLEWDQEFELLDLVAGGRLGTGVKKGFLLGGIEEGKGRSAGVDGSDGRGQVRAFCIEWGGM